MERRMLTTARRRSPATVAAWTNTSVEVLPRADHFLGGALRRIGDEVVALLRDLQ